MDDIDMDLDESGFDLDFSEPQAPYAQAEAQAEPQHTDIATDQDLTEADIVEDKIHIRGLDELTTDDIKAFATTYFPEHQPRVEWIDDTSANLNYTTATLATSALLALSSPTSTAAPLSTFSPLLLRPSKPHPTKPSSAELTIRIAVQSDKKRPRAHESSRFYLLHPEHDPREQRRPNPHSDSGEYTRNRYGDKEHRRRRRTDRENGFSASMYDDHENGEDASTDGRSRSASPGRDNSSRRRRDPRGREHRDTRRRDRSRSPGGVRNTGKELFAGKLQGGAGSGPSKELFPNKSRASALKDEHFPTRHADKTADLFASKLSLPLTDGAHDSTSPREEQQYRLRSDGIAPARRTVDDWSQSDDAAVEKKGMQIRGHGGLSIKGGAGFSIRGSAAERRAEADRRVKELFPERVGNTGKELFPARAKTRAADMFG